MSNEKSKKKGLGFDLPRPIFAISFNLNFVSFDRLSENTFTLAQF